MDQKVKIYALDTTKSKRKRIRFRSLIFLIPPNSHHTTSVPNPKMDPLQCYTFEEEISEEDIYKKFNNKTVFKMSQPQGSAILITSLPRQRNPNKNPKNKPRTITLISLLR